MTAYLCPVFQEPQFTDNDEFLAGGLLWFYEAGTSTLATAYTTETGDVAWSNPIVLDSRGESGGTIWLKAGQSYRIVLEGKPAYGQTHGAEITEHDNITGVNDPSVGATDGNWILFAGEPTYISATSFSVSGDFRDVFTEYRRLYSVNAGGVIYSSVSSASYASGVTTVVITNDSGTLDVGLSAVYYAFELPIALPRTYDALTVTDITVTNVNGLPATDMWTDSNNTFGTSTSPNIGYVISANGFRFYRASFAVTLGTGVTSKTGTHTFSSPMPTACLQVVACFGATTGIIVKSYSPVIFVTNFTVNGFDYEIQYTNTLVASENITVHVIAMGY